MTHGRRRRGRPRSTSAARCPTGVTVLEASAGTGKTYTIAALAARYVAEGDARSSGCCSSRSRGSRPASCASGSASGWSSIERGPRRRARRRAAPTDDRSSRCSPTGRRATWRGGATGSRARSPSFDAATIATTHGFCQEVLGGLGIAGDLEPDVDVRRGPRRPRRTRWSTTSTCGGFAATSAAGVRRAPRRPQIARAAIDNPARRRSSPATRRAAADAPPARRAVARTSSSAASARWR